MNRTLKIFWIVLVGLLSVSAAAHAMQGPARKAPVKPKRWVVRLRADASAEAEKNLATGIRRFEPIFKDHVAAKRRMGTSLQAAAAVRGKFPRRAARFRGGFAPPDLTRFYRVEPNTTNEAELARLTALLKANPDVESVEPDRIYTAQFAPNDPYYKSTGAWGQNYADLYGLKKLQASEAWDMKTGEGIVVAVVDTGIDYTHPDLKDTVWTDPADGTHGYDFVFPDSDPTDEQGHGTHIAGTIAAAGNNGVGVIGVAWKAKIMAVRGLDQFAGGYSSELSEGIIWATDHGADVINMSWGAAGPADAALSNALSYAQEMGVVLVAAAGDDASDVALYSPAGSPGVIAVSALDSDDRRSNFSNYGERIDVAAPGDHILSLQAAGTFPANLVSPGYFFASGTSMAAPHVAGVAALILSQHPDYTPAQVRLALQRSADDVGTPGFDPDSGHGRVNALKALQLPPFPVPTPPSIAISAPAEGAVLSSITVISGTAADSVGIARVQIIIDDQGPFDPTGTTTWSYRLDTQTLKNGPHSVRVKAWNTTGDEASALRTFNVSNESVPTPPSIEIWSPNERGILSSMATISGSAADSVGVARVQIFIDDLDPIDATGTTRWSYRFDTRTLKNGPHSLRVKSWNTFGDEASALRAFNVSNAGASEPPTIAISAPADGVVLSSIAVISGTAADSIGIARLEIFIDDLDKFYDIPTGTAMWSYRLETRTLQNGPHILRVNVWNTSGDKASVRRVINVSNPRSSEAVWSPYEQAPLCTGPDDLCDSGGLLVGRGHMAGGEEPHTPNTVNDSCFDVSNGTFHQDPSLDRLRVKTVNGSKLQNGKAIWIEADVWAGDGDFLDVYYSAAVWGAFWYRVATVPVTGPRRLQTLSVPNTIPTLGAAHAVRGHVRNGGDVAIDGSCDVDSLDDYDDLAFVLAPKGFGTGPDSTGWNPDLDGAIVRPNPWRASRDRGTPIYFDHIPPGSTVKVFTVAGQSVVYLIADASGRATWDLSNRDGDPIASGIYVYLITASSGHQRRGKLGIIR